MQPALLKTTLVLACLAGLIGISAPACAETVVPPTQSAPVDDGWRRTTRGWEHNSAWEAPAAVVQRPISTDRLGQMLAYAMILSGLLGLIAMLLLEIDPVEYNAFRTRSYRD